MIGTLKALFDAPARESEDQQRHRLQLVAAAMLIETSRADFTHDEDEQRVLEHLLSTSLGLEQAEVHALVEQAAERVDASTSLYEFTRLINDHYSAKQKFQLISAMWTVAYADGELDKYEEALIRRVAELTYVSHGDYIRSKLEASGEV